MNENELLFVTELASACISISYWGLSFAAGKSFQDIKDVIGYMGVYWLSSGICLTGAFFVYFLVPETKGKSSDEIQKFFESKKEFSGAALRVDINEERKTESGASEPPIGVDNPSFVNQEGSLP